MSPVRPASRRPAAPSLLRRGLPPVAVALAALAVAGPASADGPPPGTRSISPFAQALTPRTGPTVVATDEGVVAWTVNRTDEAARRLLIDVFVLRDGTPTLVATVPDSARLDGPEFVPTGTQELEVGTDRAGRPLAVLRTSGANDVGIDHTRLVSLVTGKVRELPRTRGGLVVRGTAVDDGRLYWTIGRWRPTDRSTSSLWRASVDGTIVGRPAKIRTSQRGHDWYTVIAGRGRVGINARHEPRTQDGSDFSDDFSFGTPLGRWRVADGLPGYAGPSSASHYMAGFAKDGGLVTVRFRPDEEAAAYATLTAGRTGARRFVLLGRGPDDVTGGLAFDAPTGRFFTSRSTDTDPGQLGYSAVAFAPRR